MKLRFLTLTLLLCLLPSAAFASRVPPAHPHGRDARVKAAICEVAAKHGYGPVQTRALLVLAYRESSWEPTQKTGSCWGLFQLSRSMCRGHHWGRVRWNTDRAITYIRHRYGTPRKALAHSLRYNFY